LGHLPSIPQPTSTGRRVEKKLPGWRWGHQPICGEEVIHYRIVVAKLIRQASSVEDVILSNWFGQPRFEHDLCSGLLTGHS
jgi:hypothetical protein